MSLFVVLIPLVLIVLSACSTERISSPSPAQSAAPAAQNPPSPPAPSPAPEATLPAAPARPSQLAFAPDFSGPDLRCAFSINSDVPPIDTIPADSDAVWGCNNVPELTPLTQPGPNALYTANGKLLLKAASGTGYGVISRQTFSRDGVISAQVEVVCVQKNDDGAWGGLDVYNGDAAQPIPPTYDEQVQNMWRTGEWFGLYFSIRNGALVISFWSRSQDNNKAIPAEYGKRYIFRIDYDHAKPAWTFIVLDGDTGAVLYNESPGADYPDALHLDNDPRFAMFLGAAAIEYANPNVRV